MKRITINALKNIRRSPYQSLAAILILTLTLFIAQTFILLSYTSQEILEFFETKPQVTAFFTDEVSEADILNFKSALESKSYVSQVTYISKQEALKIYQELNADDPLLLEMVTADILPASLEVSATTVNDLGQVFQDLSSVTGVEEVTYQQDVVEGLKRWTSGIRVSGVILVSTLIITSILVITIIISIKAAAKRQEIATMRLLGATPLFIHGPFMLEGCIYGVLSALIAFIITYTIVLYATPFLVEFMGDIPVLPIDPLVMLSIFGLTAGVASFMGLFSGYFSSRRFGV